MCDNSNKVSAWKKSHSSYIKFLRNLKSPVKSPIVCSNYGKSVKSPVSRVQSVALSVQGKKEDKSMTVVQDTNSATQQRYQVYSVKKPTEIFRQGGWTSQVTPRRDRSGKIPIRSYNLANYSSKSRKMNRR